MGIFFPTDLVRGTLPLSPLPYFLTMCSTLIPIFLLIVWEYQSRKEESIAPAGCKRLGLRMESQLYDQYQAKYSKSGTAGTTKNGTPICKIKALFIFPIKSTAPVELYRAEVDTMGLRYDRLFSFAQLTSSLPSADGKVDHKWKFITQREFPRLSQIKTEVWVPDPQSSSHSPKAEWVKNGGCIVLTFPFTPDTSFSMEGFQNWLTIFRAVLWNRKLTAEPTISFRIPISPTKDRIKQKDLSTDKMIIWNDTASVLDYKNEIPEDFLAKLKYSLGVSNPFTLFRAHPVNSRAVFRNAPSFDEVKYQPIVGLADAYPIHILNLASVRDVQSRLPKGKIRNLDAIRFRSNIYVTGLEAYDEDDWKSVRINGSEYHVTSRSLRCKLPNVDPKVGEPDRNEPLSTLRAYRIIDEGSKKSPALGMMMVPSSDEPRAVKVGDEVEVLGRGDHYFLK